MMLSEITFGLPKTCFKAYSNVRIDLKFVSAFNFSAIPRFDKKSNIGQESVPKNCGNLLIYFIYNTLTSFQWPLYPHSLHIPDAL
jgi:hypothetical protein